MGGFKLTGSGFPRIFSASKRRNYASNPKRLGGVRTRSRSSITVPRFVGLGFHPPPGRPKMLSFVCLFECPSCLWTTVFLRTISPWSCWSIETVLTPLNRGRFVVVDPYSTFSDCCQLATLQNAEVNKMVKFGVLAARGRHSAPLETKSGVKAYTVGLL